MRHLISKRARLTALGVLGIILLAACGSASSEETVTEESPSNLETLASLDELKVMFNQDEGIPRLLLLMSPT